MIVASYQSTRDWGDIIFLVVFGVVGWFMKRTGWPRAPLLIGFVLSTSAERYLHISMSRYGFDWLMFPGVLMLLALTLLMLIAGIVPEIRSRRSKTAARTRAT